MKKAFDETEYPPCKRQPYAEKAHSSPGKPSSMKKAPSAIEKAYPDLNRNPLPFSRVERRHFCSSPFDRTCKCVLS